MKSTGVVRQLDNLGRVVLPIELRRTMGIGVKDLLEVFVDGEDIILRKYQPVCLFCGSQEDVTEYRGKNICRACLEQLRSGNF